MKFFLAFVVFIVAVIAAEVPLNVAYPVQEISSCTVGKKSVSPENLNPPLYRFVSAPRSRYVFQCIKPGDGKVVGGFRRSY